MNSYQELITQALELRAQIDDLRSASYTVVEYLEDSGPTYMFVASFDLERMEYQYAVVDANWIEVKTLGQIKPLTHAAFGDFITKMNEYVKGGPHPYKENIVGNNPDAIRSPFEVAKPSHTFVDDSDLTDDEASLK